MHQAAWRSLSGAPPPARIVAIDDEVRADEAYGLACQGTALLWHGDYHNARQLLSALGNRADRRTLRSSKAKLPAPDTGRDFHLYRQARAQRARTLSALLVELDENYALGLPRAPDIRDACLEAFGPAEGPCLLSLQSLLGLIGAHEWRSKGMEVPAAGGRIHPHFGVFAPVRNEYVDLVAEAPLPAKISVSSEAFDIGTGTGVLAAVLARRGIRHITATDNDSRALDCARWNIRSLGLAEQVEVREADLFPPGRAALVVCNPPWLPARPSSPLERAIYDPDGQMLAGFLHGLAEHLLPGGEGWLVLSDLAEHLGLRSRHALLAAVDQAGLAVLGREDTKARHSRTADAHDPLHRARAAEVTSLWRLAAKPVS